MRRRALLGAVVAVIGCGEANDLCGESNTRTQALSIALYPALEFDPGELRVSPSGAEAAPIVSLLRNVGQGLATLEPLRVSDDRVDVSASRTSIPPSGVAVLEVQFVAPATATLDASVLARAMGLDVCGLPIEAELRLRR